MSVHKECRLKMHSRVELSKVTEKLSVEHRLPSGKVGPLQAYVLFLKYSESPV